MIDLGFATFLALVSVGVGKRILDVLGQAPEHWVDELALALPLGSGTAALATLALGELGCLNRLGLSVMLAVLCGLGGCSLLKVVKSAMPTPSSRRRAPTKPPPPTDGNPGVSRFGMLDRAIALCVGLAVVGTALSASAPVTDGDALCYHLQVPKVFLTSGAVAFDPDLHETVYPLITELLYALALAFRGPVACRWIQWILGLALAANTIALARPSLGRRAWWSGAIILLVPAVSNGMSAPLNDVALAAFGAAAIFAWVRLHQRPSYPAAIAAGLLMGLALGVKYPALVLCGLLAPAIALRATRRGNSSSSGHQPPWLKLTFVYLATVVAVGGCWYLRAYMHTGNPVNPFFKHVFGGAGLDEVLDPIKRPLPVTPANMLLALEPLSLEPDRFDSFSHQFGPIFLMFLPAVLLERPPRRVIGLVALAYAFLAICMTQRQSMRFLLISLGPLSIAVASAATAWSARRTVAARLLVGMLIAVLGLEACLALVRSRHALAVMLKRESAAEFLSRREPTFSVGKWVAAKLPSTARLIGQDHRGFYIPRPYAMELAHRRRTGLGARGESAREIVARLRERGFTHVMFCPPVPATSVEFDPTLSRLLAPWLAGREALFRRDISDGDGVVRRYSIYELSTDRVSPIDPPAGHLSARSAEEAIR
jgi:hypothetical protein